MVWKTVRVFKAFLLLLELSADGAYYYSNGIEENWDQANVVCKNKGLQLAKFDSQTALDNSIAYMKANSGGSIDQDVWIGMRYDMNSNPYVYRWVTCEVPVFTTWSPKEPNNQDTDQCIRLSRSDFKFRTTGCNTKCDFLCTDPSPSFACRSVTGVTSTFHATVTFECGYCSTLPLLMVMWEFNNGTNRMSVDVTTNTTKYSGATLTSPSLVLSNVAESDIGIYSCQVKTVFGMASGNSISFNIKDVPIVTTILTLYTVVYGNTVTLNCDIYAIPSITAVKWNIINKTTSFQYNGAESTHYGAISTSYPTLQINNVTFQDSGNYSCVASNAEGTTTSQIIKVQVLGDVPVVTTSLIQYTVMYGNAVTLNCDIYGTPSITDVKWNINNVTGSFQYGGIGSTHYGAVSTSYRELQINNVTFQDSGNYTCVASNLVGTTTSQTITVQVLGDVPVVKTPLIQYTVIYGSAVTLNCDIYGIPTITDVKWNINNITGSFQYGGIGSTHYGVVSTSYSELQISNVTLQDSGNYSCVASNAVGTTTSQTITVQVLGGIDVKWNINNITGSFQYGDIGSTHYGAVSTSYPELEINNVTLQDIGNYSRGSLNTVGTTASQTITLQVLGDLPVVTVNQTVVSIVQFKSVTLYCEIQSVPNASSVYWKKEVDGTFLSINTNATGGNLTEPSLNIVSTQKGDSGNYTCVAVNAIGTTISLKVRLDVLLDVAMCQCSCDFKAKLDYWATQNKTNFTFEEWQVILAPIVKEIRKNLTVDVSALTQTKLKHISVYDGRKSSSGIGMVGIIFISLIVGGLILMDITSCKRHLETVKMAWKRYKFK